MVYGRECSRQRGKAVQRLECAKSVVEEASVAGPECGGRLERPDPGGIRGHSEDLDFSE